jgi:hypothetical protein
MLKLEGFMAARIPMAPGYFYSKRFAICSALGVPRMKPETWRLSVCRLGRASSGLTKIEFMGNYENGHWEARGYHEGGNVSKEELFKEHERKKSGPA